MDFCVSLPSTITDIYVYLSDAPENMEVYNRYNIPFSQPGWYAQRLVSKALFGDKGVQTVDLCLQNMGAFVWMFEFANVHSTFPGAEPVLRIDRTEWAHVEGYFQAMKSFGFPEHKKIREEINVSLPEEAYCIGNYGPLRADWESVKVDIMRKGLRAKFLHVELRELLFSTGDHTLAQIKGDGFWGTGFDGKGQNQLGRLLMELRTELRTTHPVDPNWRLYSDRN